MPATDHQVIVPPSALPTESLSPVLPDHLTGLRGSQFALWRCAGLRGAGFPVNQVLKLQASQELLQFADELLIAEESVRVLRERALHEVKAVLDRLRPEEAACKALRKIKNKLKLNALPNPSPVLDSLPDVKDFCRSLTQFGMMQASFHERFSSFTGGTSIILRDMAASPTFREAVTWQNREAVNMAFNPILHNSGDTKSRNSRQRQHEELIAKYIQRYCTKNDSIGFFGPIGFAQFVDTPEALVLNPGRGLLTARKVYFECWPIDALAALIACDHRIDPWLSPITMPFVRVETPTVLNSIFGTAQIHPQQAAILQACDGTLSAREIAHKLVRQTPGYFKDETEVYSAMAELVSLRILHWGFNIPLTPHPERLLRAALNRVEDQDLRTSALAMLDELEEGRQGVAKAAGNEQQLNLALDNLERVFTRLTGMAAVRDHGKAYAGRTIVYEDCRRDAEVRLGTDLQEALAAPLSLLLMSARWLTSALARAYIAKASQIHADLVRATGNSIVDAGALWLQLMPYLNAKDQTLLPVVQQEFQAKWARVLKFSSETERICYSSDELQERVHSEFSSLSAGWTMARYHSPDIMIAASSVEAIRRGDYLFVLGELHLGGNTLGASLFFNQHPSPEELIRAQERDLGGPIIMPTQPKTHFKVARIAPSLVSPNDFRPEFALDGFVQDRSRAIPLSSLVIEELDGNLIATKRDGQLRFDAIELIAGRLSALVLNLFKILLPRKHNPRISIDHLVVSRESWLYPVAELGFVKEQDAATRFLRAREWARAQQLPHRVFFRVPTERKPAYLDFNTPIFVDIFSKIVRGTMESNPAGAVEFSEMLPAPDQTWLRDHADNRYTSEIRIVALDLSPRPRVDSFADNKAT